MEVIDSTTRHISGMQKIELAINLALRNAGIEAAPAFLWHRGKEFIPPQEASTLEAILQGRTWNAALSLEQIEGSGARVERDDVVRLVNDAVEKLSGRTRSVA